MSRKAEPLWFVSGDGILLFLEGPPPQGAPTSRRKEREWGVLLRNKSPQQDRVMTLTFLQVFTRCPQEETPGGP